MYLKYLRTRGRWFKQELKQTSGRTWLVVLSVSVLLLLVAFVLMVLAGNFLYNFIHLDPLPDLGHQILPDWDVRFLTRIGVVISFILLMIGAINEPHRIPYFFFMLSFWLTIRVASMTITPMGVPAGVLPDYPHNFDVRSIWDFIAKGLVSPQILFFSGHTGFPFLGHLLFQRRIRCGFLILPMLIATSFYLSLFSSYSPVFGLTLLLLWILTIVCHKKMISLSKIFLFWSLVMGISVLLVRGHYSIDVLGAYFMTAGSVYFGKLLFSKIERLCEKMDKNYEAED